MRTALLDIETDGLNPSRIWCACVRVLEGNDYVFSESFTEGTGYDALAVLLSSCDRVVMHNGLHFDRPVLERLAKVAIPFDAVIDTLVLSRLFNAGLDSHSLDAWGIRLGFPKGEHRDWSQFSEDMLEYCKRDVLLLERVYRFLDRKILSNPAFDKAVKIEHRMQQIAFEMHTNGFAFDIADAQAMARELDAEVESLLKRIQQDFKPRSRLIREITPTTTKAGTLHRKDFKWYEGDDYTIFSPGAPFSLVEFVPFNPASPSQVVDRLWEAGWSPVEKTKTHLAKEKEGTVDEETLRYGWKINERNLATLPGDSAPEGASLLVEHLLTSARRRTLQEWMDNYNPETGRIHGEFNPIGTRTQRCAHRKPNMGNVAAKKSIKYNSEHLKGKAIAYGGRMRSMWKAAEGMELVGIDMESAHLRIFAHLIDDPEFTQSLISGDKKLGTDPHSVNMRKLGPICVDRDRAKTFIFTYLNGGTGRKASEIFGVPLRVGKKAIDDFALAYPGLARLKKDTIPADARRGYFEGTDGRLIVNDSEHHMIGMYLQSTETILMKYAIVWTIDELARLGIPAKLVNWVHDEMVFEVPIGLGEVVGQIGSAMITKAGQEFSMRCPMAGEAKVGKNWLECH